MKGEDRWINLRDFPPITDDSIALGVFVQVSAFNLIIDSIRWWKYKQSKYIMQLFAEGIDNALQYDDPELVHVLLKK